MSINSKSFESFAKESQMFTNLGWRNLLSVNFPSKILIFWEIQTISRYQGLENVLKMCILVFFDEFVRGNWKESTKDSFLCKNMSSFRCWKNLPFVVYFATFKLRFAEFRHLRSWFFPSLFVSYRCIRLPNISSLYQTEIKLYEKLHDLPFVVWTKKVTSQKNHLCRDSHGLKCKFLLRELAW